MRLPSLAVKSTYKPGFPPKLILFSSSLSSSFKMNDNTRFNLTFVVEILGAAWLILQLLAVVARLVPTNPVSSLILQGVGDEPSSSSEGKV